MSDPTYRHIAHVPAGSEAAAGIVPVQDAVGYDVYAVWQGAPERVPEPAASDSGDLAARIRERLDEWTLPGMRWTAVMWGGAPSGDYEGFDAFRSKVESLNTTAGNTIPDLMRNAIQAVLDVHKPEREMIADRAFLNCASCRNTGWGGPEVPWPCETVEAIAAALGIAIHESRIECGNG